MFNSILRDRNVQEGVYLQNYLATESLKVYIKINGMVIKSQQ